MASTCCDGGRPLAYSTSSLHPFFSASQLWIEYPVGADLGTS